jgi:hypothetical protein
MLVEDYDASPGMTDMYVMFRGCSILNRNAFIGEESEQLYQVYLIQFGPAM